MKIKLLCAAAICAAAFFSSSCSDKSEENTPARTYKVGDLYHVGGVKGIVYQLSDAEGTHGLIVSLDQTKAQWSTETVLTAATDDSDGAKNQAAIMNIADWQTKYPAFAWCAAKNVGGVSGWYLPAYYQVKSLYTVWVADKDAFNKSLTDNGGTAIAPTSEADEYYWSSTDDTGNSSFALAFMFDKGNTDYPLKSEAHMVRAVHSF